jgi:hypothetical protein
MAAAAKIGSQVAARKALRDIPAATAVRGEKEERKAALNRERGEK